MDRTVALSAKRRIESFDVLKGMAIYLVVMGHVLTMCVRGIDAAFVFKLIGQIHMPVFFFISGYFTYKESDNTPFVAPRLKKRFVQLIIPFFTMSTLWVIYFPHSGLQSPLHDNLPGLYHSYWKDGYWFTLCLFELCVVYSLLRLLLVRVKSATLQALIMIVAYAILTAMSFTMADEEANTDWIGIGLVARFFPVFMLGVMSHKHRDQAKRLLQREWVMLLSVVLFAITFYMVVYPWDMPWGENATTTALLKPLVLPAMHACLMALVVAMVVPWSNRQYGTPGRQPSCVARYFSLLGRESLGIYLLHYFFLFPLTMLQEPLKAMGLAFTPLATIAAATAFFIIATTLIAVWVVKRSRILATLMIGGQ